MTRAAWNGAWLSLALLVPAAAAGCRSAVRDFYDPLATGTACAAEGGTGGGAAVSGGEGGTAESQGGGGQPSAGAAGCSFD